MAGNNDVWVSLCFHFDFFPIGGVLITDYLPLQRVSLAVWASVELQEPGMPFVDPIDCIFHSLNNVIRAGRASVMMRRRMLFPIANYSSLRGKSKMLFAIRLLL